MINEVMAHIEEAIKYVKDNRSWTDEEDARALAIINDTRCDIDRADMKIANNIRDLLNEYGDEHGLEEDWFEEFASVDDVFFEIGQEI